jgi:hypothetical protein
MPISDMIITNSKPNEFILSEPKLEPEPKQSPNYRIQIQIG